MNHYQWCLNKNKNFLSVKKIQTHYYTFIPLVFLYFNDFMPRLTQVYLSLYMYFIIIYHNIHITLSNMCVCVFFLLLNIFMFKNIILFHFYSLLDRIFKIIQFKIIFVSLGKFIENNCELLCWLVRAVFFIFVCVF